MSLNITINSDHPLFSSVLALISGAPALAAPAPAPSPVAMPGAAGSDEDETGDAPAVAGQTDKDGMPHLPSVHSDPPKLTAKGEWRKKRGVTEQEVAQAVMLWKAAQPAPAPVPPVAMPTPPVAAPAPVPMPAIPAAQPVVAPVPMPAPAPVPVPAPQPVAVPPAAPAPAPNDFQSFMVHLTTKSQQIGADNLPVINADYLAQITGEIATAYNTPLATITDIAAHPHMIEYAIQLMTAAGRW